MVSSVIQEVKCGWTQDVPVGCIDEDHLVIVFEAVLLCFVERHLAVFLKIGMVEEKECWRESGLRVVSTSPLYVAWPALGRKYRRPCREPSRLSSAVRSCLAAFLCWRGGCHLRSALSVDLCGLRVLEWRFAAIAPKEAEALDVEVVCLLCCLALGTSV